MPANTLIINGHFEYTIEDSKMEETLEYLDKVSVGGKSLIEPDPDKHQENHELNMPVADKEIVDLGNHLTALKSNDTQALLNISRRIREIAFDELNDDFKKKLIFSIEARIRFYESGNQRENVSTLQVLLDDILNDQLLNFIRYENIGGY